MIEISWWYFWLVFFFVICFIAACMVINSVMTDSRRLEINKEIEIAQIKASVELKLRGDVKRD